MWRKWRVHVCLCWTKCAEMLKNVIAYAEICNYMRIFANLCINKYSKCINKYSTFWKCHYMLENMRFAHFCKICEICWDRMIAINWYPYMMQNQNQWCETCREGPLYTLRQAANVEAPFSDTCAIGRRFINPCTARQWLNISETQTRHEEPVHHTVCLLTSKCLLSAIDCQYQSSPIIIINTQAQSFC